jgi:putative ATP-binding cassette transporter
MTLVPDSPSHLQERIGAHAALRARYIARPHPGAPAMRMLRLLAGAARGAGRWAFLGLAAAVVATLIGQLLVNLRITTWNADFFDALERRSAPELYRQAWIFLVIVAAWMMVVTAALVAKRYLVIELRRHLTLALTGAWMEAGRHYRLRNMEGSHDNEDGRIAEDARVVCEMGVEFLASLLAATLQFVAFVGLLWIHSGTARLAIGRVEVAIPGYMVWIALLYAFLGAALAIFVGRPLVRATDRRQAAEADFRASLLAGLAHSPVIALTSAEPGERRRLAEAFARVRASWNVQTGSFRNLSFLSSGFGLLTAGLPMLILAPSYLAGEISLGMLMQLTIAFGQVVGALLWLSDNYPTIAQWEASAERVLALHDALGDLPGEASAAEPGRVRRAAEKGPELAFRDVTLLGPAGEVLLSRFDTVIRPGERVLLEAPPQVAAALFRAVAGLSSWGAGRIELPEHSSPFFMAERPFLPRATLREAILEPRAAGETGDEPLKAAMLAAGVTHLVPMLDAVADWEEELALGEQQRLQLARCLVHRPGWIMMHDATSALGAAEEAGFLAALARHLPEAAVISIAHRPIAEGLYQRRITLPAAG